MKDNEKALRIGVHRVCWLPNTPRKMVTNLRELGASPATLAERAKRTGADFFVHQPGYKDILLRAENYRQLSLEPRYVDDSWWVDRAMEVVTPIPSKDSLLKNSVISLVVPPPPFSVLATEKALTKLPDAYLIRRWPFYNPDKVQDFSRIEAVRKRNAALNRLSNYPFHQKEALDVHTVHIGLTAEELLDWRQEKDSRRLMVSALMIDERLVIHKVTETEQDKLIAPILDFVSVVNLKIGDLRDSDRNILMTEQEVIAAILRGDKNCEYAKRLKALSEKVGSRVDDKTEWIIKIKNELGQGIALDEFIAKFINYLHNILE